MRETRWNPETGERIEDLGDEWERDNVFAPVPDDLAPLPTIETDFATDSEKELGHEWLKMCRLTLAELEDKKS
jgi:hypothetical protein